jgi:hypothetical protein
VDGQRPTDPAVCIKGQGPPWAGGRCRDVGVSAGAGERQRKIEDIQIADGGIDGVVLGDIPVQLAHRGLGVFPLLRS